MSTLVRVYLPATLTTLTTLRQRGELPATTGFAVTPALRSRLGEDDEEILEYEAFTLAASASLELLKADPAAPPRRVVLSVDARVAPASPDQVTLVEPVPLRALAAIHVDGPQAAPAVAAALTGAAEPADALEWYDVSELAQLAP